MYLKYDVSLCRSAADGDAERLEVWKGRQAQAQLQSVEPLCWLQAMEKTLGRETLIFSRIHLPLCAWNSENWTLPVSSCKDRSFKRSHMRKVKIGTAQTEKDRDEPLAQLSSLIPLTPERHEPAN